MVHFMLHNILPQFKKISQACFLAYLQELQRTTTFGRGVMKRGSWLSIFLKTVVVVLIRSVRMPLLEGDTMCPALCCDRVSSPQTENACSWVSGRELPSDLEEAYLFALDLGTDRSYFLRRHDLKSRCSLNAEFCGR